MMQRMKKLHTPDSVVFDIYFESDITCSFPQLSSIEQRFGTMKLTVGCDT